MAADLAQLLETAHDAVERGDWRTSYDVLAAARAEGLDLPTEAVDEMGRAAWWLGYTGESIRLSEESHRRFLEEGEVGRAAASAADIAIVALMRGHGALGSGWLNRARRLLEGRPECLAHGLVSYIDCEMALDANDLESARSGAAELRALGDRLAEPTLTSLGMTVEGVALARAGEVAAGLALLDEAMLPVVGGQVVREYAGAIYCLAISACTDLADLDRAREWTEATERWCEQFSDAVMYLGICRVHRAHLLERAGAWDRAEREALRVCEELADINQAVVAEGFYQVGEVRRLRGEADAAVDAYRRARALGRVPQPGEALLALARGDAERAWAMVAGAFVESRQDPFTRGRLLLAEVEIADATGRVAEAEDAAVGLSAIADRYPSRGLRTWADHARGTTLLIRGDAGPALEVLGRVCHEYDSAHAPYEVAHVRLLLARCQRALGRDARAAAEERAAQLSLAALGAATPVDDEPPGGLTPRELEVLSHLARGASNRGIGEALCITEKTVGRHLSNIYLKLDVGSRTAAAAWAHAHRLTH